MRPESTEELAAFSHQLSISVRTHALLATHAMKEQCDSDEAALGDMVWVKCNS